MAKRTKDLVNLDDIFPFKFRLQKARKFAGLMQNGKEIKPVHLQTLPTGYYKVCDGRHRVAAAFMLGKKDIISRYSNTPSKKEVDL